MPLNDVLEVTFVSVRGEQTALNVRHYKITGVVAPEPTRQFLADSLSADNGPDIRDLMVSSATYRGLVLAKIDPLPREAAVFSTAGNGAGSRGGDALPSQVCGLITLRTAVAGRKGRGRIYAPFPSELDNDGEGKPIAAYITELDAWGTNFDEPIIYTQGLGNVTLQPVIFRRATRATTAINAFTSRTRWATQRRRGPMGAPNVPPV